MNETCIAVSKDEAGESMTRTVYRISIRFGTDKKLLAAGIYAVLYR